MDTRERELMGVNGTTRKSLRKRDATNQSTRNSRKGKPTGKPPKPYKDLPLFPRDRAGVWGQSLTISFC